MSRDVVTPPLREKKARLLLGQRLDLMHKSNARVQLWRALQALIQSGHPQQDEPDLPTVRDVAYLLQSRVFQSVGLIHNQQLDQRGIAARDHKLLRRMMV